VNITFLIGNGFDRNLGLDTTYSQFVKYYKNIPTSSENLKIFQNYISENEELWSNAEIAMGKYTGELKAGAAAAFSECHTDFCEQLAQYLKKQESRINYETNFNSISSAFSNINSITQVFPTQERALLDEIIKKHRGENTTFNFVCFNYTRTLDECLNIVKENSEVLGKHQNGSTVHNHKLGEVCHVHGTVEKEMVFGVNDDSQISKIDIFDCEDGDLYKNMLIKIQANASYLENTDTKAAQLIQNSQIIYIYGMSIGDTDKLWWDRICTWLSGSLERHLIIQKYDMPVKGVVSTNYQVFERKCKQNFTKHYTAEQTVKNNIEKRIHVTNDNIFSAISGLADKYPSGEQHDALMEQIEVINNTEINKTSKDNTPAVLLGV